MKQSFFRWARIAMFFCASLLLLHACNKTDHWPKPPGCPKPPSCDVEKMLVTLEDDSLYTGPRYPAPYKYYKTYGPGGRVNFMDAYVGPMWTLLHFSGAVEYSGNLVYMRGSGPDTALSIKLNQCGQPESFTLRYDEFFNQHFTYEYDHKGRLLRAGADVFEYDRYDNVISIREQHDTVPYITYTYDYSRPAKGIYLEQDFIYGNLSTEPLEMLGLLNLQSHHLRTSITNTRDYPTGTDHYYGHVVSNGYVQSYKRGLEGMGMIVKSEHTWRCGSKHEGQKYQ